MLCLAAFVVVWIALAIAPSYRADWLLENAPVLIGVPLAVLGYRRLRLSDRAYVQATIFVVLHVVGAHYTYSEVPLGDWVRDALGLARNHYDRLDHFSFGLLMLRPIRQPGFRAPRPGALPLFYFSTTWGAVWKLFYHVVKWSVASGPA